jgi:K(+)-stimulated pyrophosphate-energized sodium pump
MIELLVVCVLSALAFALSYGGVRSIHARRVVDDGLVAAARAVAAGATRYLRRQYAVAASLSAVVGAVVLVAYGVAYQVGGVGRLAVREHGILVSGAFVVGVVVAVVVGWVGSWVGVQTAVRVADGARRSLDEALALGLRGGMVTGLLAQASGTFAAGLGVLALYGYFGGFRGERAAALGELVRIPLLLAGLALGAALVSFLGQIGGGIFGRVADIGADVAGKLEADLPEDASTNPATIADLVGDQVGDAAANGSSGVASTVAELVAQMMVAALVFRADSSFPSITALVLFPLVVRAFGSVAGWFGGVVVRTDDTEAPSAALRRGLLVAAMLTTVATVGSATWLLGAHSARLACAAVVGVAASVALLFVVRYFSDQRHAPVRALADTAQSGASLATLRGLLVAADATLVVLFVLAGALLAAYRLGASTGVLHGGMMGVAMALGGLRGTSVFISAMAAMGTAADTATGILELSIAGERPDVHARARVLAAEGSTAKNYHRILQAISAMVASSLMMGVFREWVSEAGRPTVGFRSAVVLVGALLGVIVVVAFFRVLLGGVVSAGRELIQDLRQRFVAGGTATRSAGIPDADAGSQNAASQDACVEAVARSALRGTLPPALVGVILPLFVGVGLRLCSTGDSVRESAEALVAFVIVATIAGGLGSLLFASAGSAWDNAKRYIETGAHGGRHVRPPTPRPPPVRDVGSSLGNSEPDDLASRAPSDLNPAYSAAVIGDTIGDPLKGAIAPSTSALIETLALLVMVFHPFFL